MDSDATTCPGDHQTVSRDRGRVRDVVARLRAAATAYQEAGDRIHASGAEAQAAALEFLGQDSLTTSIRDSTGRDPARVVDFYTGFPQPRDTEKVHGIRAFIAAPRLEGHHPKDVEDFPAPDGPYSIDSGAFTELQRHGTWREHPDSYGARLVRYTEDCRRPPDWCAPQDWPCEPWVIQGGWHKRTYFKGTGLTLRDHLEFTVANYVWLKREFYFLDLIPVIQGWRLPDYLLCKRMYEDAGVDLNAAPVVGLGSVCRREGTREAEEIINALRADGIQRLHGFGVKITGLARYGRLLHSADSQAWSDGARRRQLRLPTCRHEAADCRNCLAYLLVWREKVLNAIRRAPAPAGVQGVLFA